MARIDAAAAGRRPWLTATDPSGRAGGPGVDFTKAPLVVAWEITRACPLRCLHCRADAQHRRDPGELTTAEGIQLIEHAAEIGVRS